MGGFTIEDKETGEYLGGLNLPCRNVWFEAISDAGQAGRLDKGIVWTCPDCIHSEVRVRDWLEACRKTLAWLEKNPRWEGHIKRNWAGGETNREVAMECLKHVIEGLERARGKTVIIHDEFMMCDHPNLRQKR
jgi:hypothetical protein